MEKLSAVLAGASVAKVNERVLPESEQDTAGPVDSLQ